MEATMEAVGLMLVGVAIGAVLASVWHRQWLAVGIEVRGMAADHLERSRAHLDRAAGHLALVQEVEGRWGLSYPWFHVHPGESLWDAVERERREKLAKTADLGANPGKPVLEDARGDVFGAGRRGEDGAKPASGGDPWFGWTGPPDPPVRLGAGTYPTGLAVDPTPWCPECRAFHPANQTGMLEQCAACMEAMPHLGTRCQECGAEWGEFCRPGCATRLKHTGVAVERKLRQGRGSAGAPIWDAAERVEAAELVASDDWGFIGPKYATLEEVAAVHGPVVETFEPRYRSPLDIANPANYFDTTGRCVAGPLKEEPACTACGQAHFGQCSALPSGPCGICGWDHHESVCPDRPGGEASRC